MIAGTSVSGTCTNCRVLSRSHVANSFAPTKHVRTLPRFSATSSTAVQLVDNLQPQLTVQNMELSDSQQAAATQTLQVLKQYSSDMAAGVAAAWAGLTHPLAVFGDAWLLNVLFLGSISLLAYALLVLAPRQ